MWVTLFPTCDVARVFAPLEIDEQTPDHDNHHDPDAQDNNKRTNRRQTIEHRLSETLTVLKME